MAETTDFAAHRAILGEIQDQRYNIEHAVDSVQKFDGNVDTELTLTKEHFSKLKFNFVELETKSGFIQGLASHNLGDTPVCAVNDAELKAEKARVKEFKASNAALKQAVGDLAEKVFLKQGSLQEKSLEYKQALADATCVAEDLGKIQAAVNAQQDRIGPVCASTDVVERAAHVEVELEDAKEVLARQQTARAEKQAMRAQLQAEVATLQCGLTEAKGNLTRLREDRDRDLTDANAWYTNMNAIMAKIGGTSILARHDDSIVLGLLDGTSEMQLTLTVEPTSGKLVDAQTDVSSKAFQAILDAGVAANDVKYIIRELKGAMAR